MWWDYGIFAIFNLYFPPQISIFPDSESTFKTWQVKHTKSYPIGLNAKKF